MRSPDAVQRAALAKRCAAKPGSSFLANRDPGSAERHEECRSASGTRDLPRRLARLPAAVGGRLVGDARVMSAIGQALQRLAAAEEEIRAGRIADRPMAGALAEFQQRAP